MSLADVPLVGGGSLIPVVVVPGIVAVVFSLCFGFRMSTVSPGCLDHLLVVFFLLQLRYCWIMAGGWNVICKWIIAPEAVVEI